MPTQKRPAGSRQSSGGRPSTSGAKGSAPGAGASNGAPRRLGNQATSTTGARSAGAARRYERSKKSSSSWIGWASVGVVVVLIIVLVAVKLSGGSSSPPSSSTTSQVSVSGRNPVAAPSSLVSQITTIPAATYNSVGTAGQGAPFTVTKGQKALTSNGKAQFVYVGGEFCPYCALMRWSMISALSRFGTFTGLKLMSSAPTDGDISTFSFVGSTYTSKYVTFSPYETEDRQQNSYQSAPNSVNALYAKYDGTGTTGAAPFSTAAGIPFLDIGNKYVSSGDPAAMANLFASSGVLNNGGPGRSEIAAALRSPSSTVGKAISADLFIAQANYISAGICSIDGGKPASVCASPGVVAAAKVLAAVKPVS